MNEEKDGGVTPEQRAFAQRISRNTKRMLGGERLSPDELAELERELLKGAGEDERDRR